MTVYDSRTSCEHTTLGREHKLSAGQIQSQDSEWSIEEPFVAYAPFKSATHDPRTQTALNTVDDITGLLVLSALDFVPVQISRPRRVVGGKLSVYQLAHLACVSVPAPFTVDSTNDPASVLGCSPRNIPHPASRLAGLLIPKDRRLIPCLSPASTVPFDALAGSAARFSADIALVSLGTVLRAVSY